VTGLPARRSEIGFVLTLAMGMAACTLLPYALGALGPFITDELGITRTALGSLTTVTYAVGAALSPVAGPLVDRFGGRRSLVVSFTVLPAVAGAAGWRTALGGCALVGAAGLGLIVRYVPRPAAGGGDTPGRAATGAGPAEVAPAAAGPPVGTRRRLDRAVNRLTVYALLMGFGVGAVGAYLPLYAVERLGLTRGTAGLAAALMGFVGIVARVGWGRRQDRTATPVMRSLGTLALGSVVASGLLWAAAALGSGLLWAGAALFGATAVAWNALGMLSIVRDVEVAVAGRASGRVLLGFYIGFLVGPVTFGWSVDHVGYGAGWAAVTAAFAVASGLTLAWIWDG
jgi:predicted MFS family arabinose efflux permease